ncbi:MAG: type 4a pilus biogenesis protein PilO [Deltaproteobacteria bacterium]|jgi:type IV pilus assembly protein PilO|nr:type 4a pilus biogenesis protein PilO [Deltaproteobacteria bacterium]
MAITAEDLKKLSPGMKAALVFFACLLIGYFYYFFYLQNALVKKGNLEGKLEKLQQDITAKKAIAAQKDSYIQQLKKLRVDFREALTKLPDKKELPGLVESVSLAGRNSGVDFLLFEPIFVAPAKDDGKKEKKGVGKKGKDDSGTKGDDASASSEDKFYIDIPIRVKVLGTFPNTLEFFDKISQLPRIINVEDLVLNLSKEGKDKKGRRDNEIVTTGVIKTYMFLGNEGMEKGSSDDQANEKE